MYEILLTRYKIADELQCIHLFHFVHNVILLCVVLDSIRIHTCCLYWKELYVIELVMEFYWCFDIAFDTKPVFIDCLE